MKLILIKIFGVSFIALGIIFAFTLYSYTFPLSYEFEGFSIIFLLSLINILLCLSAGLGLFMIKGWGRKLAIIFCIQQVVVLQFVVFGLYVYGNGSISWNEATVQILSRIFPYYSNGVVPFIGMIIFLFWPSIKRTFASQPKPVYAGGDRNYQNKKSNLKNKNNF